tara:strand:+ start:620 stop:898 length:279 start_codon:yes stop_codon:yes gene_type:complete
MSIPFKIEVVEPNYHEDDIFIAIERHYDEWTKDDEWWYGGNTWDVNVYTEDGIHYYVYVYGLVKYDDGLAETDTSRELDKFTFTIKGEPTNE